MNNEIEKGLRAPWGSPGGKRWLAHAIVDLFPDHTKYVEPFAGGAAVFWAKDPSEVEVLADLDAELIQALKFIKTFSESEFKSLSGMETERSKEIFDKLKESSPTGRVEKFHRWLYLRCLSHGAEGKTVNPSAKSNYTIKNVLDRLSGCKERLKGVTLLAQDWEKTIQEHDGKDTFFYFDPPYAETTCDGLLPDENGPPTNEKIVAVVSKVKGLWILSLNDSPSVRKAFEKFHFKRVETPALRAEGAVNDSRKELLIANFEMKKKAAAKSLEADEIFKLDFERNPKEEDNKELVFTHSLLHTLFKRKAEGSPVVVGGKSRSLEDIINYHALVIQEMKRRDMKHRPHDDLDRRTYELLGWELPEEMKKQSRLYAPVFPTGAKQEGGEVFLQELVNRLRSFKLRHEFGYLVGAIANEGRTENDIDVLWRGRFADDLRVPLEFRIFRQCPQEWWPRFHFLEDIFHGPFTNAVALYDLVVKLTNPLEGRHDLDEKFAGLHQVGWEELSVVREALDEEGMTVDRLKKILDEVISLQQHPRTIQMGLAEDFSDLEKLSSRNLDLLLDLMRNRRDPDNAFLNGVEADVEKELRGRLLSGEANEEVEKQRAASPDVKGQAATSKKTDSIRPFRFFVPPKPIRGAYEEDRQTILAFVTLFEEDDFPVFSSKKYDGTNVEVHRVGDRVEVWTEDGENVTPRLPGLVEAVKDIKADSIVFLAELETWRGRKHQPREVMAGYLHSKDEADDGDVVANVYRIVYLNGKDVHAVENEEAIRILKSVALPGGQSTTGVPNTGKKLNKVPFFVAENKAELIEKTQQVDEMVASEGNVAYPAKWVFDLGKERGATIKYHRTEVVNGIVSKRIETKVSGVYNYEFAIRFPKDVKPKEAVEVDGREYMRVGKAFSTDTKVDVGEVIVVEFESFNLIRDEDKGTVDVSAWAPRFLKVAERQTPDDLGEAVSRARDSRLLAEKVVKDSEVIYKDGGVLKAKEDPFIEIPVRLETYNYVVQEHWRGKSVHADFRFETEDPKVLLGWTLNTQIKGAVDEPVTTLAEAKRLAKNPDDYSKIDWKTGQFAQREREGTNELVNAEIVSERKAPEPHPWLTIEGKTKDPVKGDPPPVGATKNYPGVFNIVDKGTVEYGSQKVWLHEYFPKTKMNGFDYRIFFRQLRASAIKSKSGGQLVSLSEAIEEDEFLKAEVRRLAEALALHLEHPDGDLILLRELSKTLSKQEREIVVPAEETEFKTEAVWLLIKPIDQTPYVLSNGAEDAEYIPPQGASALPAEIRRKVPAKYAFWRSSDQKKRLELRGQLREAMRRGDVDFGIRVEEEEKSGAGDAAGDFDQSENFSLTSPPTFDSNQDEFSRSQVHDHGHEVELDEEGNGLSTVEFGHCHAVESWESENEEGHTHEVTKKMKNAEFVLQRRALKGRGEKPIREGPTTVEFDLRLDVGDPSLWLFVLDRDPTEYETVAGFLSRDRRKENMNEGNFDSPAELAPGHPLNPSKDTLVELTLLDRGNATVLIDEPEVKKVIFDGEKSRMNGTFLFSRRGENWKVEKTRSPQVKSEVTS